MAETKVANKNLEEWAETREEEGKSVEYLMVKCPTCKQPHPSRKILRLSKEDFDKWQGAMHRSSEIGMLFRVVLVYAPFILGMLVEIFYPLVLGKSLGMLGMTVGAMLSVAVTVLVMARHSSLVAKGEKRAQEVLRLILAQGSERYEHVLVEEVGEYITAAERENPALKYVVWPEKS